jgi:ABC-type transport system involved in multi-copper enzyme maturation permease subunit
MRPFSLFGFFELPLLQRELIQTSHKKRTYALRVAIAAILAGIMLLFYSDNMRSAGGNVLTIMGRGRDMAGVLLGCCLAAIYILMPALACSAISTEREKQTLSLLLISRITPTGLIIEKSISRLLPLAVIVLIVSPMMAISYVLGGLSGEGILAGLLAMLLAALQVNTVAIFCSSIYRNALEAFFSSYLILAALALGPAFLQVLEIFPPLKLVPTGPTNQLGFVFDVFMIAAYEVMTGAYGISVFLWVCIAPATVALAFFIASCFVVSHWRQDAPLDIRRMNQLLQTAMKWLYRSTAGRLSWGGASPSSEPEERPPREIGYANPAAWREVQSTALAGWKLHLLMIGGFLLLELWLAIFITQHRYDREAITVLFRSGSIILSLLMMLGIASRSFASERERQTLDLLLTTPLTNQELLSGKLAASSRALLYLMLFAVSTMIMRCLFDPFVYEAVYVDHRQGPWSYAFGVITHTWLYLTMAKWIGAYFSITTNSLMKAMLASLLTLLGICIIPVLALSIVLVLGRSDPDDFPLWFFSSPAIFFILNESLETGHSISRSADMSVFWMCINLGIYSLLTFVIRGATMKQLSARLGRVDRETELGGYRTA